MFDVGWSEILVVGVVALIVVGPKELPALLRTVGRYAGVMKRHAAEFRAQFDEAMREAELDQIKKDVENIKSEAEASLRSAETSVADELSNAKRELETAGDTSSTASANGHGSVAAPEGEGIQGPVIIPDEPAPQETAAAPAEPAAPASSSPAHFNGSSGSSGEDTPAGKSGV